MTTETGSPVEDRILGLLQHLGIERAHFASNMPGDWSGMVMNMPEIMASLSLVCPAPFDLNNLEPVSEKTLFFAGDQGRWVDRGNNFKERFPQGELCVLKDYSPQNWTDFVAERTEDIGAALTTFLSTMTDLDHLESIRIDEGQGEVNGILYKVQGEGPPLVLLPVGLAPTQWTALLPILAKQYTTIILGGAYLGFVARLEERWRTGYLPVVNALVDSAEINMGDSILDMGCGTGAFSRLLAKRTAGKNRIVAADVSPYMIAEASAIAKNEGLDSTIEFREANAEAIPFPDDSFDVTMSCTMLEEVDAEKAFAEMLRVTKPGGRLAIVVRGMDMPGFINVDLPYEIKHKFESKLGGLAPEGACANASIYSMFHRTGLENVKKFPYMATFDPSASHYFQSFIPLASADLTSEEQVQLQEAIAQAKSEGTFFMCQPLHCAIGTKPR